MSYAPIWPRVHWRCSCARCCAAKAMAKDSAGFPNIWTDKMGIGKRKDLEEATESTYYICNLSLTQCIN